MWQWFKNHIPRRDAVMAGVMILVCVVLGKLDLVPVHLVHKVSKVRAEVLEVDNSQLHELGLLIQGEQILQVRILGGKWQGATFRAVNVLRAQMDLDKIFKPGDHILTGVPDDVDPQTFTLNAQDHYRIHYTIALFALFGVLLLIYGHFIGFTALLSFVFTCLVIWKLVIPLCLLGYNALIITFAAVTLLSAVIIFLVAGLNLKGITAFCGAIAGVLVSSLLAYVFTHLFKINGAVMPYSQALLYSGYEFLSLSDIYIGAIFLSSSGAVMDLAMDVAAGMEEVSRKSPGLSHRELWQSGLRMGRAVVGTMTTTLLLAYSGGFLTLMMTFAAQGIMPIDFINNPYVTSEVVKTIIGSFGLVLVAPFTAALGAWLFHKTPVVLRGRELTKGEARGFNSC